MIERLVAGLNSAGYEPTWQEVADAVWLAPYLDPNPLAPAEPAGSEAAPPEPATLPVREPRPDRPALTGADNPQPAAELHAASGDPETAARVPAIPVRGPAAPALRHTLALSRALRPLVRRIPSDRLLMMDEQATADRIAQDRLWVPVLRPAPVRWLDLVLVVDATPSMTVWRRTVTEIRRMLERLGAFRDVRGHTLDSGASVISVSPTAGSADQRPIETLVDPLGRRLLLVVTDGVGAGWWDGRVAEALGRWGRRDTVAVLSLLPQRMWPGTGLRAHPARLHNTRAGSPNARWRSRLRHRSDSAGGPPIPVLELNPAWLGSFASLVAGAGWTGGALLATPPSASHAEPATAAPHDRGSADDLIEQFRSVASPAGYSLACYLAAVPLNQPTMRLVQQVMLPGSETVHLAEVFLGGLLHRITPADATVTQDEVEYDFRPGVRERLVDQLHRHELASILVRLSEYMSERFGLPLDFGALLADPEGAVLPALDGGSGPLARVTQTVLRRLGGRYRVLADRLAAVSEPPTTPFEPDVSQAEPTADPAVAAVPKLEAHPRLGDIGLVGLRRIFRVAPDASPNPAFAITSAIRQQRAVVVVGAAGEAASTTMHTLLLRAADRPLVVVPYGVDLELTSVRLALSRYDDAVVWVGELSTWPSDWLLELLTTSPRRQLLLGTVDPDTGFLPFHGPWQNRPGYRDVQLVNLGLTQPTPGRLSLPDVTRSDAVLLAADSGDEVFPDESVQADFQHLERVRDALVDPGVLGLPPRRCRVLPAGGSRASRANAYLRSLRDDRERDLLFVYVMGTWNPENRLADPLHVIRTALLVPARMKVIIGELVGLPEPQGTLLDLLPEWKLPGLDKENLGLCLVDTDRRRGPGFHFGAALLDALRHGLPGAPPVLTVADMLNALASRRPRTGYTVGAGIDQRGFVRNRRFGRRPDPADAPGPARSVDDESILRQLDSAPEEDGPYRAALAMDLAEQRSRAGLYEEARVLADEAARLWRSAAEDDPEIRHLWLADALQLAGRLRQRTGDPVAAVAAFEEAASALNISSVDLGRRIEALTALSRAYTASNRLPDALRVLESEDRLIRRALLSGADARTAEAFAALNALAERAHLLHRLDAAPKAAEVAYDCVRVSRRLAQTDPDLDASLASLLANYAAYAATQVRADRGTTTEQRSHEPSSAPPMLRPDPVEAGADAVDMYRRLVQHYSAAYEFGLALSLHNLGALLGALGRYVDALDCASEAVDILRRLTRSRVDGTTLVTMAPVILTTPISADDEAVLGQLQYLLAGADPQFGTRPGRSDAALARALMQRGVYLRNLSHFNESSAVVREALSIRRRLSTQNPELLPELAEALLTAVLITSVGQFDVIETVAATEESVDLYERLVRYGPNEFAAPLRMALSVLVRQLDTAGRHDDAARARSRLDALDA
ncbi:SAV_2336 N-terminal domain-related protein [Plantactinospora solaniradicis]|uniref:SAV_2336 N-terminal domain-related protein n=1 Tax=Plantactinospora solaniradicis TaxID=1723736 RepID=A0ABW1K949_9ACTN